MRADIDGISDAQNTGSVRGEVLSRSARSSGILGSETTSVYTHNASVARWSTLHSPLPPVGEGGSGVPYSGLLGRAMPVRPMLVELGGSGEAVSLRIVISGLARELPIGTARPDGSGRVSGLSSALSGCSKAGLTTARATEVAPLQGFALMAIPGAFVGCVWIRPSTGKSVGRPDVRSEGRLQHPPSSGVELWRLKRSFRMLTPMVVRSSNWSSTPS